MNRNQDPASRRERTTSQTLWFGPFAQGPRPFAQTAARYLRFCIVGGSGVLVDMAVLFLLADPRTLALNLSLSKAIAAEVALLNNFVWNEFWTFRDLTAKRKDWRARAQRLAKFNLICLAGIGLSILLLNVQVRLLGLNIYLANLIAIFLVSFWNFGLNLKFAWSTHEKTQGILHR